jgi:hypothetical protein
MQIFLYILFRDTKFTNGRWTDIHLGSEFAMCESFIKRTGLQSLAVRQQAGGSKWPGWT